MDRDEITNWLLAGDVSIQYQTHRDLLGSDQTLLTSLKNRIAEEGWGHEFLIKQNSNGHWGIRFYQPKWTSTNYTLLDLRNLCADVTPEIQKALKVIIDTCKGDDGSINGFGGIPSDVCVNGMFLNYACYFGIDEESIRSVVDFILSQKMPDGGFNCLLNRYGAVHSSMHTTINTLEGIREYLVNGYRYRREELFETQQKAHEFLLMHHLFRSDRTGEIIDKRMLKLAYPSRWKYDILRALDYFRSAEVKYDTRMKEALDYIAGRRMKDGRWKALAPYPGHYHFKMEEAGTAGRWNTLRALRVLEYYGIETFVIGNK